MFSDCFLPPPQKKEKRREIRGFHPIFLIFIAVESFATMSLFFLFIFIFVTITSISMNTEMITDLDCLFQGCSRQHKRGKRVSLIYIYVHQHCVSLAHEWPAWPLPLFLTVLSWWCLPASLTVHAHFERVQVHFLWCACTSVCCPDHVVLWDCGNCTSQIPC